MKQPRLPFMSVVLCAYNGANVVGRAIESLLEQDYPSDRFEIIIVDDGSSDSTAEVARRYPVRLVQHERNLGIAPARNTGLAAARGDVLVCFDDDCIVEPGWLRKLASGYTLPDVAGVASVLTYPKRTRGLTQRFMSAEGSASAPRLQESKSSSPLSRLWSYVVNQFGTKQTSDKRPYAAQEIYSATSSFPVDVLKAVGGWDASLHWMEDVDICRRIKQAFPEKKFWVAPAAEMLLDDLDRDLREFVMRPWIRGPFNFYFYTKIGLTPPLFPFPMLWVFGTLAALVVNPPVGLAVAVVLPQVLYAWWPLRALRERNAWHLVFAYMQLAEELMTVAGIARGWVAARREVAK